MGLRPRSLHSRAFNFIETRKGLYYYEVPAAPRKRGAKEGSHSGLVRTLGKRVWSNPPGVRISYPPPENEIGFGSKNMVGTKCRLF